MSWFSYWSSYKRVLESKPSTIEISIRDVEEECKTSLEKTNLKFKKIKDKIKELFKVDKVEIGYGYDGWTYAEEVKFSLENQCDIYKRRYIVVDSFQSMFLKTLNISVFGSREIAEDIAKFIAELDGYKKIDISLYKEDV